MNSMRVFVLLAALLSLAGFSFAVPSITCGTLSSPGTYTLTSDVTTTSATCFTITSGNVVLDCAGFTISGASIQTAVVVSASDVTVKNCRIIGDMYTAIQDTDGGTARNNYINNTIDVASYGSGIQVENAQTHTIANNTVYSSGLAYRLYLDSYFSVINNTEYNNQYHGFYLNSSSNNTFIGNSAHDPTYFSHPGFYLYNSSNNAFTGNVVFNNPEGFKLEGDSNNNNLMGNTVYDNTYGFYLFNVNNTITADNIIHDNNYGIYNYQGLITIRNSTIYNNEYKGLYASAGSGMLDVNVLNSFFYGNGDAVDSEGWTGQYAPYRLGIANSKFGSSSVNISVNDSQVGQIVLNEATDPSGSPPAGYVPFGSKFLKTATCGLEFIQKLIFHWDDGELGGNSESSIKAFTWDSYGGYGGSGAWSEVPYQDLDTGANTLTANSAPASYNTIYTIYGLFIKTPPDNCVVIDEPGTYVMQNDFVGAPNEVPFVVGPYGSWSGSLACVEILSSNVVFDCDGHSITDNSGWRDTYHYGVVISESNNVTLKNCHNISGYGNNVNLNYANNAHITNNTLTESYWGVYSYLSSYFNAVDNGLYGNQYGGFVIVGGNDNSLTRNTVAHGWDGVSSSYSNNLRITGDHYYDNNQYGYGYDLSLNAGESYPHVYLSNVIFDNPLGNYQDFTNLSMDDYTDSYIQMSWAQNEYALPAGHSSFAQKFIDIESGGRRYIYDFAPPRVASLAGPNAASLLDNGYGGNEDDIDSITWNWRDDELTGYTESKFGIWRYDGVWAQEDAALNTAANTLTITHFQPASLYGILASPGGQPPVTEPSFRVVVRGACNNVVTVTSSGNEVEDATVTVDGAPYTTNSTGQVEFQGCGKTVTIRVAKPGYAPVEITRVLAACSECRQCTSDDQCASTEQCAVGRCTPVTCTCGVVQNHQCMAYACCSDSQCASGQTCVDHQCVRKPQSGCDSDGDCLSTQVCDKAPGASVGTCVPVQGCGAVDNHRIIEQWQCGAVGCPVCPQDYSCINHQCLKGVVTAPTNLYVGDNPTVHAETNGKACANCAIEITDPTGNTVTGTTDEDGNMVLPLKTAGAYKVVLTTGGVPLSSVTIKALTKPAVVVTGLPTGVIREQDIPLLLLVLLLVGIMVVYFRSRGKKK